MQPCQSLPQVIPVQPHKVPVQLAKQRKADESTTTSRSKVTVEPLANFFDKMEKTKGRRSKMAVEAMGAFVELKLEEDARRAQHAKEDRKAAKAAHQSTNALTIDHGAVATTDPVEFSLIRMLKAMRGGYISNFYASTYSHATF